MFEIFEKNEIFKNNYEKLDFMNMNFSYSVCICEKNYNVDLFTSNN